MQAQCAEPILRLRARGNECCLKGGDATKTFQQGTVAPGEDAEPRVLPDSQVAPCVTRIGVTVREALLERLGFKRALEIDAVAGCQNFADEAKSGPDLFRNHTICRRRCNNFTPTFGGEASVGHQVVIDRQQANLEFRP